MSSAARRPATKAVARSSGKNAGTPALVRFFVHPPGSKRVGVRFSTPWIVKQLLAGLPVEELDDLQAALDVPKGALADMLGISKATLHRRKMGQLLGPAESERVVRFARLMGRAVEVFGSETAARQWLNAPQRGLGGAVPLHFARTEVGAREVEDLLGRIEFGVYS